jgi:hypothetical protein
VRLSGHLALSFSACGSLPRALAEDAPAVTHTRCCPWWRRMQRGSRSVLPVANALHVCQQWQVVDPDIDTMASQLLVPEAAGD